MKNLHSRSLLFIVILATIILASCNNRPAGILNNNDMTNILFEMHKLDGSLDTKRLSYSGNNDKNNYYKSILKKYNITQAEFDSSLIWYTKNPKKFEKIYVSVYDQITKLQEDVESGKYHPIDSIELLKIKNSLWNRPQKIAYTKDSTRNKLNFEIKNSSFQFGDVYILKFLQQIAPEDSCSNQHILLKINYYNGKIDSIYQKTYNDSLLRRYIIRFPAIRKLKIKSISGALLGSTSYKGKFNALTDSISLVREYRPDLQDSIRNIVLKKDPIIYKNVHEPKTDSLGRRKISSPKFHLKANKKIN